MFFSWIWHFSRKRKEQLAVKELQDLVQAVEAVQDLAQAVKAVQDLVLVAEVDLVKEAAQDQEMIKKRSILMEQKLAVVKEETQAILERDQAKEETPTVTQDLVLEKDQAKDAEMVTVVVLAGLAW